MLTTNPALAAHDGGYAAHIAEWIALYKNATGDGARYPDERAARMEAKLDEHMQGRQNHEKLVWQMLVLEPFLREHRPAL